MKLSLSLVQQSPTLYNACDLFELSLRSLSIPLIENLATTGNQFESIDLSSNSIQALTNFPKLSKLQCVNLSNNNISKIAPASMFLNLPSLHTINLTNNEIATAEELVPLGKGCPNLRVLNLNRNPVTNIKNYRFKVLQAVGSTTLKILDGERVTDADRKGAAKQKLATTDSEADSSSANTFAASSGVEFLTSFTSAQQKSIKEMIASANSPAEVDRIEESVRQGVFPKPKPNPNAVAVEVEAPPRKRSRGDSVASNASDSSTSSKKAAKAKAKTKAAPKTKNKVAAMKPAPVKAKEVEVEEQETEKPVRKRSRGDSVSSTTSEVSVGGTRRKRGAAKTGDGEINFAKLKVAELRAECEKRGLDTKGLKAALVERLQAI